MSTKSESEYNIRKNSLSLSLWLSLPVGDLGRRIEKTTGSRIPHDAIVPSTHATCRNRSTFLASRLPTRVVSFWRQSRRYKILLCFEGHVLYERQVGRYKYMSGVWEHAWSCTKLWVPSWRSGAECRDTRTPVGHPPRIWLWNSKSLVFVCE